MEAFVDAAFVRGFDQYSKPPLVNKPPGTRTCALDELCSGSRRLGKQNLSNHVHTYTSVLKRKVWLTPDQVDVGFNMN